MSISTMNLDKNMAYSPILDVIMIKEYGALNDNLDEIMDLEVPRPNELISDLQDSYCSGKIMLAMNGDNSEDYPVTVRATTSTTTITSVPITPIPMDMRTTQSGPTQISCVQENPSRYIPKYIKPPRSSLNYNKMKRSRPPTTALHSLTRNMRLQ